MPNYSKGCIYMIKKQNDFNNDNVYIGSTCNFIRRKHQHKSICNNENSKDYNLKLYQYIRENDGWDAWVIIKIIDYPCSNKSQLNIIERNYIDDYKSKLNCTIPTRTRAEYRIDNKEKIEKYFIDNKEKITQQKKQYQDDNKEKIAQRKKQWHINNREKIAEKHKQWRNDNKEKITQQKKQYHKEHYEANKDKILQKHKEKVICDNCGCKISKNNLASHKRTQKCINLNSK